MIDRKIDSIVITAISILETIIFGLALLYTFPLMKYIFDTNYFLIIILIILQNANTVISNSYTHGISEYNLEEPYYFTLLLDPLNILMYNLRLRMVHIMSAIIGISAMIIITDYFISENKQLIEIIEIKSITEKVKSAYNLIESYYLHYVFSVLCITVSLVTMRRMSSMNELHKVIYPKRDNYGTAPNN